jgi:hypothetical protein
MAREPTRNNGRLVSHLLLEEGGKGKKREKTKWREGEEKKAVLTETQCRNREPFSPFREV